MGDRTKSSQHITKPTIPLATEAYLETHRAPRVPLEIGNLQGCRWILLRPTTMATTSIDESNAMVDRDVGSLQQAISSKTSSSTAKQASTKATTKSKQNTSAKIAQKQNSTEICIKLN